MFKILFTNRFKDNTLYKNILEQNKYVNLYNLLSLFIKKLIHLTISTI